VADIELRAGDAVLNVDTLGGGLRALRVGDWQIVDGYGAGQAHSGRRGHILAPWPNRIYQGRYAWRGRQYQLPISDPKHDSATHGLVDKVEWEVDSVSADEAALSVVVEPSAGYPFHVQLLVNYQLAADDLTVVLVAQNLGDELAPFGVGMHPYFRCGTGPDETLVDLPVTGLLPLDEHGSPAGALQPFDGDLGLLGPRSFDTALRRDPDRREAALCGPAGKLTIGLGAEWRWLMLFTGDALPGDEARRSIAVEPMTCPPNAFATDTDVITLTPGVRWRAGWSASWEPA
jgi:aldose 1-epimerase